MSRIGATFPFPLLFSRASQPFREGTWFGRYAIVSRS